MSNVIEVIVRGGAGSGKSTITLEIAKVLRSHGLTCQVEVYDPHLHESVASEEIQSRRLQSLATSDRVILIKEVQAPRSRPNETNFS